jgi:hypothetical protein
MTDPATSPDPDNGRWPVTFLHLRCATRVDVGSRPIAGAFLERRPDRHGVADPEGAEAWAWTVVALRPPDKERYPKLLSAILGNRGSVSMQLAWIAQLLRHGGLVGPGLKRAVSQNARGSKTPMHLYCERCGHRFTATSHELAAVAEQLHVALGRERRSVQAHPGQLIAYVADRGEVLEPRDGRREQLARRDQKAAAKAPKRLERERRGHEARGDARAGVRGGDVANALANTFDVLRVLLAAQVDPRVDDAVYAAVTAPVAAALGAVTAAVAGDGAEELALAGKARQR